jgi:hypothetical protein
MSHDLSKRLARFLVAATAVATAAVFVMPLLAAATGVYAARPMGVGALSRLLLLFLPQAVAVVLPFAAATSIFFVCRSARVTRQVVVTVGAFTIATALVTAALNVSVAPATNATFRELAFGDAQGRVVNGRRLHAPGEPGERFQTAHRWTLAESVLVLAALALVASRIAPRSERMRRAV